MYTGKSVTMNVGLQFNCARRRLEVEEERKEGSGGGHVDLISKECKIWDSCWLG